MSNNDKNGSNSRPMDSVHISKPVTQKRTTNLNNELPKTNYKGPNKEK